MKLLTDYCQAILLITLLFTVSAFASGDKNAVWRPVTPAELGMQKPQVEPDADAEAIFWEVRLDDRKRKKLSYNHYVRVKIFTERGRERFSKFDIPFSKGKKVEDVAARVIKPDGTITNLQPSDIFEREIFRANKIKVKAKSFAVPGIEPGVIVEYKYKESFKGDSLNGERLIYQRDIPMQRAVYYVRPYKKMNLQFNNYNMPEVRFVKDTNNFYVGTLTNVPALKEEPYMPPEDEVRQWISLSYMTFGNTFRWGLFGTSYGQSFDNITEPNKVVKQKARELTSGASSDKEKLERIYNFVQKNIRNATFDTRVTERQRDKLKIKKASDVLKYGMGETGHVDILFASLARAAGFATGLAFSGNRSENFFNPVKYNNPGYVHPAAIAVLTNGSYEYFNPGTPYLAYGQILWYEEGTKAIITYGTGYVWKNIPLSNHNASSAIRTGDFKLSEDGTLEGKVKIEYNGHQAIFRRKNQFRDSLEKRRENVREELKERLSSAEISNISISNFDNADLPLTYSFDVRIPNYAQKTGKRMFFQPSFFEYGANPVFSAAKRKHPIYFPYPWSEKDKIEIKMPEGFELESAIAPGEIADESKVSLLSTKIGVEKSSGTLIYDRDFYFGNKGNILFPVKFYRPIKSLFDSFHKNDKHTLTLKKI